jgi:hypothetical protein
MTREWSFELDAANWRAELAIQFGVILRKLSSGKGDARSEA